MPIYVAIPVILLVIVSLFLASYWGIVAIYAARTALRFPTARTALRLPEAAKRDATSLPGPSPVCVLIPAHNEASVIGELVQSLLAQDYPSLHVAFVLDRCTDDTRRIIESLTAGDARFQILEIDACPPGWAGKVNALWTAATSLPAARNAELLLFADADTKFDPRCVRATVGLLQNRRLDMLSLLSTLTADRWFEVVVQPATALELVRQYPLHRIGRERFQRPFANGQFILFRREAYDRIGGHSAVRNEVFEDVRIAQVAANQGLRIGAFLADSMLHCRMYKDWPEFRRGWNRIYSESCNRKPARLRRSAFRVRALGTGFPLAGAACLATGLALTRGSDDPLAWIALASGAISMISFWGTLTGAYWMGGLPVWSVPVYPIGAWLAGRILRQTADDLDQRRPIQWAGKEYVRDAR